MPRGYPAVRCGKEKDQERESVDEEAISDEFVKQHYAGLNLLLQQRIKDAALAADMLNEALALALSHMRSGRVAEPDRLPGYVYRVAMNLYRNYRRGFDNRADLRIGVEHIEQLPAEAAVPVDAIDPRLLAQVRLLVAELPTSRDREILRRFYFDEQDKAEICLSLKLSALHFDKVMFRARQRMRKLLEAKGLDRQDFLSVLVVVCTSVC